MAFFSLRRLARLLTTIVAVAPLFAVSLEVHTGPTSHSETQAATWMSPGALHPDQPRHIEASKVVRTRACPACILQMQSACDGVAHAPALVAPDLAPTLPRPETVALGLQSHPAVSSRGPPTA